MRVKTRHQEEPKPHYEEPPSFILIDDSTLAREEPPFEGDNADNMERRVNFTVFDTDEDWNSSILGTMIHLWRKMILF